MRTLYRRDEWNGFVLILTPSAHDLLNRREICYLRERDYRGTEHMLEDAIRGIFTFVPDNRWDPRYIGYAAGTTGQLAEWSEGHEIIPVWFSLYIPFQQPDNLEADRKYVRTHEEVAAAFELAH